MAKVEKGSKPPAAGVRPAQWGGGERSDPLRELNRALARLNRETLIQLEVTKKKRPKR